MKIFLAKILFFIAILTQVEASELRRLEGNPNSDVIHCNNPEDRCYSCPQGWYLSNGICYFDYNLLESQPTDSNCAQIDLNKNCLTCSFRYVLIANKCVQVSDKCQTWDSTNALCTSCYSGYTLSSGVCSTSPLPSLPMADPNCAKADTSGNCLTCSTRYILKNGICVKVSDQCQTWDSSTGLCTSCYDAWTLQNGVCSYNTPPPHVWDPLCAVFAGFNKCKTCSYRSVLINGKCTQVSDQCKTWDQKTALCNSCYGGYTLTNDGVCK